MTSASNGDPITCGGPAHLAVDHRAKRFQVTAGTIARTQSLVQDAEGIRWARMIGGSDTKAMPGGQRLRWPRVGPFPHTSPITSPQPVPSRNTS